MKFKYIVEYQVDGYGKWLEYTTCGSLSDAKKGVKEVREYDKANGIKDKYRIIKNYRKVVYR